MTRRSFFGCAALAAAVAPGAVWSATAPQTGPVVMRGLIEGLTFRYRTLVLDGAAAVRNCRFLVSPRAGALAISTTLAVNATIMDCVFTQPRWARWFR